MASQPTYDPKVWVGGITSKQLARLYSAKAGNPLLSRAHPGPVRARLDVEADHDRRRAQQRLHARAPGSTAPRASRSATGCSRTTSPSRYGCIDFAKALQISCDTFFYRVGYHFWQKYGTDPTDVNAKDPLVTTAKDFGFGKPDRHRPARARPAAGSPTGTGSWPTGRRRRATTARSTRTPGTATSCTSSPTSSASRATHYRAGDAVNFAIGQGDTLVTPLQLARAYAALSNGGTLYEPRVAKAIVGPDGKVIRRITPQGRRATSRSPRPRIALRRPGAARHRRRPAPWPGSSSTSRSTRSRSASKTGSAEVYGKQSTSWVASYDKNYVVVMMVTQAGTGSGTSGPAVRKIWEALYGVNGMKVDHAQGRDPRRHAAARAAGVRQGRLDPAADAREGGEAMTVARPSQPPADRRARTRVGRPASTGC